MASLRYGLRCLRDIGATASQTLKTTTTSNLPVGICTRRAFTTTSPRHDDTNLESSLVQPSQEEPSDLEGSNPSSDQKNWMTSYGLYTDKIRPVPASPSYFTRLSKFVDSWVRIQELQRKYGRLPTLAREDAEPVLWKSREAYRLATGENVRGRDYTHCMAIVKQLHLIHPDLMPKEVMDGLYPFKREIRAFLNIPNSIEIDRFGRAHAVGRRKTSVARVWVVEGSGEILVNGKRISDVFGRVHDRDSALWALKSMERMDKYNVWALTEGGGTTGQAEALALAIGKALVAHEPSLKSRIKRAGCLTRDFRKVERKKHGHIKSRKSPTWVKR